MESLSLLGLNDRPPLQAGHPLLWLAMLPAARQHAAAHAHLHALLADYLHCAPHAVPMAPETSTPRCITLPTGEALFLNLSYADQACLIGICLGTRIGVDLVAITPLPDWQATATLYLGPEVCAALAALPAAQRDEMFARRWSEMEARSKCLGVGLSEYSPTRWQQLHPRQMRCKAVSGLPSGFVASVACYPPCTGTLNEVSVSQPATSLS